MQNTSKVTPMCVRVIIFAVEEAKNKYSECLAVASVNQHAKPMRGITLPSVAARLCLVVPHYLIQGTTFGGGCGEVLYIKICFDFL